MKLKIKSTILAFLMVLLAWSQSIVATPTQPSHDREYEEKMLNTNMIVNDVLEVGFSRRKIDQFLPVFDELDDKNPELFIWDANQNRYETKGFYIYGLASTKSGVLLRLDFAPTCRGNDINDMVGMMYKKGDSLKKGLFPVTLVCQDSSVVNALPWDLPIIPTSNGTTVTTAMACSPQLWMIVENNDIPVGGADSYRTELVLEVLIDYKVTPPPTPEPKPEGQV